jgi:carbamoyl-phosphate synthase large subunit
MINVLMTGAGAPGGPGIIQALKKDSNINLVVCDANEYASGRFLNNSFYKIPSADSSNFITEIFKICIKENINVIFPLVTRELFVFAEFKKDFEAKGIKIIVSDKESLNVANNKSALCTHLRNSGILTPDFRVVNNYTELKSAFLELGFPKNPIVVKPSISNGSRGVRIINNNIDEFDLMFNYKPNSLYMSFSKLKSILKETNFPELLISEYLPGEEYTIDTLVIDGKAKIIIPRIRSKMNGGISVEGEFIMNNEIIKYCENIISSMHLVGPIGIQVKKATDGNFKILEINPRIQGTSVAALGAGINLPVLAVNSIVNSDFNLPSMENVKWGTKFTRYYQEIYF